MSNADELFNGYLKHSHAHKATDLHLCAGSKPLIRVNGKLVAIPEADNVMPPLINEIINHLLKKRTNENNFSSDDTNPDDADNKLFESKWNTLNQNGVMDLSFSIPGLGRFRANIYSQRGSFAMAIRMLPFNIPSFSELGLPPTVESFTAKTKGLFLVTGATGSGKSTTLASLIDLINARYNYHIITIEDPIEYLHRHNKSLMTQREIGEDTNSFASALRSALREDPDVIMVGEMRDPETISIAITAAETGHLVLSTLHTIGAAKSIDRIIDGIPQSQQTQVRSQLATVLEGIVSQQLIPRIDQPGIVLASEVMFVNTAIRNLIREGKHYQINSIMQTGQTQGMQLMDMDLAKLVNAGIIDKDEAMLRASDQQLLMQFIKK